MPTPEETRRLELQPGTPVAMHVSGYTAEVDSDAAQEVE
jgi:hypothetical protein